jgi:isoleucyl-tRNA synthetase
MSVREKITAEIEKVRQLGQVGSSLEAAITIKTSEPATLEFLQAVGPRLWAQVAIVSECFIALDTAAGPLSVEAKKTGGAKCPRCWQWRGDIGSDAARPDLCGRCAGVMKDIGR